MVTPIDGITIPKGFSLWLDWNSVMEGALIDKVNVSWSYAGSSDLYPIEAGVKNTEYYIWNIPDNFNSYKNPVIIYEEDNVVEILREPIVSVIPDLSTNVIDSSSFNIVDPGYFSSGSIDSSIAIVLEMRNNAGQIVYSQDNAIYANIKNYKLNDFVVTVPVTYPGTIDYKQIDIHVANTANTSVEGIVRNVKIV
jgi:hypothetical protein